MRRIVVWSIMCAPAIAWVTFSFYESTWWIENLVAFPVLFFVLYLCLCTTLLICQHWIPSIACLLFSAVFFLLTPKSSHSFVINCVNPITVTQFNLHYNNENVNGFINHLMSQPSDLVVLQEVAPQIGDKLQTLSDVYPYYYGGQEGVGYPSSQMVLSRFPLKEMSVFMTPDEQAIIRGIWKPNKHIDVNLMIAHPTSPRTKQLWNRRNAVIETIELLDMLSPNDEVLVVGDFNLSSVSLRFGRLFPSFQTAPVAGWPNWASQFDTPGFTMIANDHLWLKSGGSGRKICSRRSVGQPEGSDHKMVITQIGY